MKNILIEGWREISHSFAMVNQYQIFEWLKLPAIQLRHIDLPYYDPSWANRRNDPSFPAEMRSAIMGVAGPNAKHCDSVYRIAAPFAKSRTETNRVVTFMVTEFGLSESDFAVGEMEAERFCEASDLIVTPSNWSKMKLVEFGFPVNKVEVVPHGVNSEVFYPLSSAERTAFRSALEVSDDHFLFLNVGALTDNKGIHLLLYAFAIVRQRHSRARLVLKDSSGLFPLTVSKFITEYMKLNGALPAEVLDSIYEISGTLSLAELRLVYGAADMYVSPYLAEGFNLPVIEAIACGTPVIVTQGGATDDFCDETVALPVLAERLANAEHNCPGTGFHLQPEVDSLVEQMEKALFIGMSGMQSFADGRSAMVEKFSWRSAVQQLNRLL